MAGYSINYLTPTAGLGGEITKGTLLALNHKGAQAATGVIIGKLSYSLSQLLFVVMGSMIILCKIDLPTAVWISMFVGSILLGAGIIGFLAVQKYGKLGVIVRWLANHRIGGKALKKAVSLGSKFALLVGQDEVESGKYTLKDLRSGEQEKIEFDGVSNRLGTPGHECD
jgi:hypothetical protein